MEVSKIQLGWLTKANGRYARTLRMYTSCSSCVEEDEGPYTLTANAVELIPALGARPPRGRARPGPCPHTTIDHLEGGAEAGAHAG